jgi:glucose uptake protein GlcU
MSVGILVVGFAVSVFKATHHLYPTAMLGGVMWAFANTLSQRVITGLGLAVAILVSNVTNCLTGWAIGRYGLFGVEQKLPESDVLNVCGLISLLFG